MTPERDVIVDADLAASLITAQFPALSTARVTWLGEGCDSAALEVGGRWVFRFPKRPDVERQLHLEARLLPRLAESLPVPIPAFVFHGAPSPAYPFHFVGYAKLPGAPGIGRALDGLARASIAPVLGRLLGALHTFSPRVAASAGVPPVSPRSLVEDLGQEALEDLGLLERGGHNLPYAALRGLIDAGLVSGAGHDILSVLVHGDLAAEHVLVDEDSHAVTGVIDWSELALSDPAIDFAGLFHWGGRDLVEAALPAYGRPVDPGLIGRACYLAACRAVADLVFALERDQPTYRIAGLQAIAHCLAA